MRAGVIASALRRPAVPPIATWIDAAGTADDSASYTLGVPGGATGAGVLVAALARKAPPEAPAPSIAVNGVPATILGEALLSGSTATIAYAPVAPAGPLNVTVSYSATTLRCQIAAWATDSPVTALDIATGSSGSLYTEAGASVLVAAAGLDGTTFIVEPFTERYSGRFSAEQLATYIGDSVGAGGPLSYSASRGSAVLAVSLTAA